MKNIKSRKLWIIIIFLTAGLIVFYFIRQPAKGTVKILPPADTEESKKDSAGETGLDTYQGKYISFPYPDSYELKTKEASISGILERVVLLGRGISSNKLTVTAAKIIKADSLEEISGVQARRLKPKIYQEKPLEISGQKGIIFEKKEIGYEKTAFFLADQILVTIALTSVNRDSALDNDFDFILKELTLF